MVLLRSKLSKEHCGELVRLKNPSTAVMDVCEKFLILIGKKETSWRSFKSIAKNHLGLVSAITNLSPEQVTEDQLNHLLPVWQQKQVIISRVSHVSKTIRYLVEWMGYCVEYKLKLETLNASKNKLPELERKIKDQMTSIANTNAQLVTAEKRLEEMRIKVEKNTKLEKTNESINHTEDMSIISVKSSQPEPSYPSIINPMHDFPNFGSDHLYGATFASKLADDDFEIKYEGANEIVGCCRTKFFCF